jgi:hypothetical protein
MYLSSQLCRKHKEEDHNPGLPGVNIRPYLKNNQGTKGMGAWLTLVEHLPRKHRAQGPVFNPCTEKNKNNQPNKKLVYNC